MPSEWITVLAKDGGSFRTYLSRPAKGSGPGLLLLQEIFGVNETMRAQADQLAGEGYAVVVPDLFWRLEPGVELDYSPEGWQRAFELYGRSTRTWPSRISPPPSRPCAAIQPASARWGRSAIASVASWPSSPAAAPTSTARYAITASASTRTSTRSGTSRVRRSCTSLSWTSSPARGGGEDQGGRGGPARHRDPRVPRGRPRHCPGRRRPLRRGRGDAGQLPLARIPAPGAGTGVGVAGLARSARPRHASASSSALASPGPGCRGLQ